MGGEGGKLTGPRESLGQSADEVIVATEIGGFLHVLFELHGKGPCSFCIEQGHMELLHVRDVLELDLLLLELAGLSLVKLQRLVERLQLVAAVSSASECARSEAALDHSSAISHLYRSKSECLHPF